VIDRLGRLPDEREVVTVGGWRFEALDMDDRRIDKLFVQRVEAAKH
jgi:putative hemolysin